MPPEPVPAHPGWDDGPARPDRDPRTAADREAWLDHLVASDDPPEPEEEYEDFEPLTAEELAGICAAAADEMLAIDAAATGRRGPGMAGSARIFPGESSSPAASFGPGMALDVTPGCPGLAVAADAAAGEDDQFAGVSDAELLGVVAAWDRVEAHAAARKLAAVAELYRRRPGLPGPAAGPGLPPPPGHRSRPGQRSPRGEPQRTRLGRPVRPGPERHGTADGPGPPPSGTGFCFIPASRDGPPGGYGTWRLHTPGDKPDLIVALGPIATVNCDHRYQARGHDPGVKLRHLTQVRYATCTGPGCRRPAAGCDFEHNTPYEAGGRTCLCNGGPKCRYDHRLKQHPKWTVDQLPDGTFRWTTPSGRQYTTEPTRHPV
jgi:hypothetical protein